MPIITIIECEKPCGKRIEILDEPNQQQAEVIQVTDAMGRKFFFCGVECFQKFAREYKKATELTN